MNKILFLIMLIPHNSLAEKRIIIDLNILRFYAIQDGKVIRKGKAVGGRSRCSDQPRACKTPIGVFKILVKYGKYKRSAKYPLGCNGNTCAKMSWFQKFHKSGIGLHASDEINVNYNASHGCVRLTYEDALWLHSWAEIGNEVQVLPY